MGLFSKSGWDKVSKDSVEYFQTKLGSENFAILTRLLNKYKVFENKIFSKSEDVRWLLPFLLSRVGLAIMAQSGDQKDAKLILYMAVLLEDPQSKTTAHYTLALIHYSNDRRDLAKIEAKTALEVHDMISNETRNKVAKALNQQPLTETEDQEYTKVMQSILDGTLKKEDISG